jgi:hypothetical protein
MSLYLRLLLVWIRAVGKRTIQMGDTIELKMRVWPQDLVGGAAMPEQPQVNQVTLPAHCGIANLYNSPQLVDAFAARLPVYASSNPEVLARFIFSNQPSWVGKLMRVRDFIVAGFGLKTAGQLTTLASSAKAERIGIFKIYSANETEIIMGEDDKHLDFRISILCSNGSGPESSRVLTVTTVVSCHNRLGRTYIFAIAPFHRMVVKSCLRRAGRVGWPQGVDCAVKGR